MGIVRLPNGMLLQVLGIQTVFGVKWGHFKWPKMNGFHWGYFTPISGVIIVTSFTTGRGPLVQSQCNHSQVRICAILLVPGSGKKIPSSKLTWQWKIPIFNREYIFNWSIFHCHVSLPEGNDCHDWIGNKRIYYPYDTFIIISYLIRNPIFKVISNHFPPFVFWISFRGLVLQCLPFVHYINIKNSPLKKK